MGFLCVLKMYHVRLYIVEKMGFGTAPRRCGIHSKPRSLLQKTCLSYTSETLAVYVGICLRTRAGLHMQAATHMWRPRATLVILFPKIDFFCSFKRFYFPFLHLSSKFNI